MLSVPKTNSNILENKFWTDFKNHSIKSPAMLIPLYFLQLCHMSYQMS